jgi:folate-binding protein YgfZ
MNVSNLNGEVLALRKSGGFRREENLAIIEIAGKDAAKLLQARLSNDVSALEPGQGQSTCLLDRKAAILVCGCIYRLGDRYWLLVDRAQAAETLALLEEFRFREQVGFSILPDLQFLSVHGRKVDMLMLQVQTGGEKLAAREFACGQIEVSGKPVTVLRRSTIGEPGLLFISDLDIHDGLAEQARALNMVPISNEAYAIARLEAGDLGLALHGLVLPETGLESTAVSYTKGCFPGQEVLARIKTYGAPRRGSAGLVFDQAVESMPAPGTPFSINGEEAGIILAIGTSAVLGKPVATVIIQRENRVPGKQLTIGINGALYPVTVVTLPFYTQESKDNEARTLYDKALKEFADGDELDAVGMLREVIELRPTFGDAYETLGVILSRHDELDEAIKLMNQLAALDPRSIMAHANLSVFYMQKGDKEAAEEEKAVAMSIRMSEMARSVAAEKQEEEERRKRREASAERMTMFREVLKIDSEDFLANAGLGSVYVDLEQYADAIPYLEKALVKRPNHTVAYVSLGEAFEKLGKTAEAVETYKKGVVVASQRGDGEPLKKMQIRLNHLGAGANK